MTDQPDNKAKTGIELLREAFPKHQISKLPKPTKRQTEDVRNDFKNGARCEICGGWHHPKVIHLDYVGHAALTDRLLDCDPRWNWAPVATTEDGTPKFDSVGGMWIRLTVCEMTRLGYGHAEGKSGGDAIKEVIGDALRNAAMRFGAALDLWHKGELHVVEDDDGNKAADKPFDKDPFHLKKRTNDELASDVINMMGTISGMGEFKSYWVAISESHPHIAKRPDVITAKNERKAVIGGEKAS